MEGFDASRRERFAAVFRLPPVRCSVGCMHARHHRPCQALIDRKGSALTRDEAARYLGAHLCRCTGYGKSSTLWRCWLAVRSREAIPPGASGPGAPATRASISRLGDRDYVDDIRVSRMLHGALRLADHARATVLRIDTTAARGLDGVEAVLTDCGGPGDLRFGIIHADWPVSSQGAGRPIW